MALKPNMSKADMKALIKKASEEVGRAFSKADPGQETPAEETPDGSSASSSPPDTSSSSGPPASVTGDASAGGPPPDASGAPPDASASAPPTGDGDPAADTGDQVTPEALFSEYSQLDLEALKMHVAAANAALQQVMSGQGDGSQGAPPDASASAGGPPPSPGAAASPPAGPPPPAMKAEAEMHKAVKDLQGTLSKAEKDIQARDSKINELTAQVAQLDASLTKVVTAVTKSVHPGLRKSVAGISDVRVSGKPGTQAPGAGEKTLSKSEAIVKLNEFARSGKATAADRNTIVQFCVGKVPMADVQKFLTQ